MQTSLALKPDRAALYGRVSTDQQGTAQQEARCKEYAHFKRIAVAAEFLDDDVSGSVPIWDRPGGRRLRDALRDPDTGIRHVIVARLDRLGRSAVDLLKTVQFLDELNVVLHIVDLGGDSLSSQGAGGRLMFTVLAGMAEYERELIRSRINDKLQLKRSRGELTGTEPYGWTAVPTGEVTAKGVAVKKLKPNPAEQKWILWMRWVRATGKSYGAIAAELNNLGVPTKRAGLWQAGNVAKVLQNKTVSQWLESLPPAVLTQAPESCLS